MIIRVIIIRYSSDNSILPLPLKLDRLLLSFYYNQRALYAQFIIHNMQFETIWLYVAAYSNLKRHFLSASVDNSPVLRDTITISGAHINDKITQQIDNDIATKIDMASPTS